MTPLKKIRQQLVQHLWVDYRNEFIEVQTIESIFRSLSFKNFCLDHFAIIDLPSRHSGLNVLSQVFSAIGYTVQGRDYLPEKQNDFLWMAEEDAFDETNFDFSPQVVVADFRLDELPLEVKKIIEKHTKNEDASCLVNIKSLSEKTALGDENAATLLLEALKSYFLGNTWPLPTVAEFKTVNEFNELLGWTLLFGRQPNHFGIVVQRIWVFSSLEEFNTILTRDLHIPLNHQGGTIKGGESVGIAQSSTIGQRMSVKLPDGMVELSNKFVELVWRYPKGEMECPSRWQDYYTGFVPQNANYVIESLYRQDACALEI